MYSWKSIRIACAVLLALPLIHLAILISTETLATLNASPEVWSAELEAYARDDRELSLPEKPIVVIGGRRVKLWGDLEDILAPAPVLMRGLGDATVDDIIHHYSRLVAFYQPSVIVYLPSQSEFHIRDNKMAEELVSGIKELAALSESLQRKSSLVIFTPVKTPLYPSDDRKIDVVSNALTQWAASQSQVTVLNSSDVLATQDGHADARYFRNDGINLSPAGYLRLSLLLRDQLETAIAFSTDQG
ncbi:MAG: hypothetical protein ABJ084_05420 [Halioglobus sp.]